MPCRCGWPSPLSLSCSSAPPCPAVAAPSTSHRVSRRSKLTEYTCRPHLLRSQPREQDGRYLHGRRVLRDGAGEDQEDGEGGDEGGGGWGGDGCLICGPERLAKSIRKPGAEDMEVLGTGVVPGHCGWHKAYSMGV